MSCLKRVSCYSSKRPQKIVIRFHFFHSQWRIKRWFKGLVPKTNHTLLLIFWCAQLGMYVCTASRISFRLSGEKLTVLCSFDKDRLFGHFIYSSDQCVQSPIDSSSILKIEENSSSSLLMTC